MILHYSFLILFLANCLQTVKQKNFTQNVNKKTLKMIQKYQSNKQFLNIYKNTVYFDNILHHELNNNSMEIEKAFKNTIVMNGVQYIYKRDFYWRTWRYANTAGGIIYFKSQSINPVNCTKCHVGFWVIEEKPPACQYEMLALRSNQDICVFTQRNMINDECPTLISVRDLIRECRNPIRTKIRITYKYNNDVFERNTVICQGREFCEITTLYSIYPNFIVFQMINSTNNVFYSRIMKDSYRNYVYTNYINLGSIKKKENNAKKGFDNSNEINKDCFNISNTYNTKKLFPTNGLHYKVYNTKSDNKIIQIFYESKLSPCKKLQLMQSINQENEDDIY